MSNYDYFNAFVRMAEKAKESATLMDREFSTFNKETLDIKMIEMHDIEHSCDGIMHEVIEELIKEFLPPIEREDIIEIVQNLDSVTDCIEEVFLSTYIVGVEKLEPEALKFTQLIVECTEALYIAVSELHNYKKSKQLKSMLIKINDIEEKGDALYIETSRKLYHENDSDALFIIKWSKLYERFERCLDACENLANVMESVILKNS